MKKIKKKNSLNLILSKKSNLRIIKKKKILLIGGTGLLGSECRNEFKKKNHYTMTMSRGIKNNLRVNIKTKNYYDMPKEEI
jgi:hypothetical protein